MMRRIISRFLPLGFHACLLSLALPLTAAKSQGQEVGPVKPSVITHHSIHIQGKKLAYTAEAGFLPLMDPNGITKAHIFSISYRLDRPKGAPPRPVIFAWNGGPGSNSGMVHLGIIGPRVAKRLDRFPKFSDTIKFEDNPYTWLQFADLVMVDAVNSGYSFAVNAELQKGFLTSQGDALSLAEFIRVYLEAHDMEHAPMFLAGESYGTFRAAGVSYALAQHGIPVNGLILLSCMLDFKVPTGIVDAANTLPSFTAAAWGQGKLSPDLQKDLEGAVAESAAFAGTDYLETLAAGDAAQSAAQDDIAKRLEHLTAVPADIWKKHHLQMSSDQFSEEFPAQKNKYLALYDTRMTGETKPDAAYDPASDPSLSANGINVGIIQYIRSELNFRTEAFYNGHFGGRWPQPYTLRGDWVTWDAQFAQSGESRTKEMKGVMELDPKMLVFVASGYFDFAAPFGITLSAFNHMDLSGDQHSRIEMHNYRGGHMMYLDEAVKPILFHDVSKFVLRALR